MKKIFAILCGLILLTSCGEDDTTYRTTNGSNYASWSEFGWSTQADPLTGISYRCMFVTSRSGGGAAIFCTELEQK